MSAITQSVTANSLKKTLNKVVTDKSDGYESDLDFPHWMQVMGMSDAFEDDLEMAGPGLASEKPEAQEIATGTVKEGVLTRYIARTWALKMIVSREALEDQKYPKVIDAARRLKRALYKTADIDATNLLVRMADTNYVLGDGLPVSSAAHTLANGGTFSNKFATDMSPSVAALDTAVAAIRKMVGHDGIVEGFMPKTVVCPVEQWGVWEGLTMSKMAPNEGNFAEINIVKGLNLTVRPLKHWYNTTTNWAMITSNDFVPNWRWKRKPGSDTWVEDGPQVMMYSCHARWARGLSDPRGIFCSEA